MRLKMPYKVIFANNSWSYVFKVFRVENKTEETKEWVKYVSVKMAIFIVQMQYKWMQHIGTKCP